MLNNFRIVFIYKYLVAFHLVPVVVENVPYHNCKVVEVP